MEFDEPLRAELLRRGAEDQRVRSMARLPAGQHEARLPEDLALEWRRVDDENATWLDAVVEEQGWPLLSRVGPDASTAAWLLAQHADHHPQAQRRFLAALRAAVTVGEASPANLAYLEDRLDVNAGRVQKYGTQFAVVDGVFGPQPVEDPAGLDRRRAEVGLEPFAEYERRMRDL